MRHRRLAILGFACLGLTAIVRAGGVEADPNKEYRLGPKDGPFMIYIASFRGDSDKGDSPYDLARKLVYELRSSPEYKMQAYMFSRSEQEKAQRDSQLKEMHERLGDDQYLQKVRIIPEWGVLI